MRGTNSCGVAWRRSLSYNAAWDKAAGSATEAIEESPI